VPVKFIKLGLIDAGGRFVGQVHHFAPRSALGTGVEHDQATSSLSESDGCLASSLSRRSVSAVLPNSSGGKGHFAKNA
jgi:hypothetical protein